MRMGAGVAGLSGAGRRFGAFRDWTCCVSVSTSIGEPENKKIVDLQAFQAADGTRTHDLLHGKQTVTAWAQPLSPCKYGALRGGGPRSFPAFRCVSTGLCPPIAPGGHATHRRGRACGTRATAPARRPSVDLHRPADQGGRRLLVAPRSRGWSRVPGRTTLHAHAHARARDPLATDSGSRVRRATGPRVHLRPPRPRGAGQHQHAG
jgi:hypothetical protein